MKREPIRLKKPDWKPLMDYARAVGESRGFIYLGRKNPMGITIPMAANAVGLSTGEIADFVKRKKLRMTTFGSKSGILAKDLDKFAKAHKLTMSPVNSVVHFPPMRVAAY